MGDVYKFDYLSECFFSIFTESLSNQFSCNTSVLEDLQTERVCINLAFSPYKNNNCLESFLLFLLFAKTKNYKNELIYIIDTCEFILFQIKEDFTAFIDEQNEIYIAEQVKNKKILDKMTNYKNLSIKDLFFLEVKDLNSENHLIHMIN